MKKIIIILVFCTSFIFSKTLYAAKGYEGYAIYRDGVSSMGINYNWHAGLMDEPSLLDNLPITHIGGTEIKGNGKISAIPLYVDWVDYNYISKYFDTFMWDNSTLKGIYKPKASITSAQRDKVKATGRNLITQNIPFKKSIACPISYDTTATYVPYNAITKMRCDGVVEYCYEWNNIKIFGGDNWDISKNDGYIRNAHFLMSPYDQAGKMTLVTSTPARPSGSYK